MVFSALGLLVFAVLVFVGWRYNPLRKFVQRSIDPRWRARARVGTYSAAETARAADAIYISSTLMRDACDVIWDEDDADPPPTILGPHQAGTVVWVNTCHVARFIAKVLPQMTGRFTLVTAREENTTRDFDVASVLANENVAHWFMENYEHPKALLATGRITPLPHGLNYHKLDPASTNQSRDMGLPAPPAVQQLDMDRIRQSLPALRNRPLRVYCNFHLNMDTFLRHPHALKRAQARGEARRALQDKDFIFWEPRQAPRHLVWQRHADVSFEVAPRGNSIDCHRTWEALILGTIPIVKSTPLDPIYDGLPVAIVTDWSEVTAAQCAKWKADFLPWFEQPLPDRLFTAHWVARFRAASLDHIIKDAR
jgi:hypothetical protein